MSDLIERLRAGGEIIRTAKIADPLLFDLRDLVNQCAAALEAQAKRIAELEAERNELSVIRAHARVAIEQLEAERYALKVEAATKARDYEHEKQIVRNIWTLLGNPSYESLKGRTIYDLIAEKYPLGFKHGRIAGLDEAKEFTSKHEFAGEIAIEIDAAKEQA